MELSFKSKTKTVKFTIPDKWEDITLGTFIDTWTTDTEDDVHFISKLTGLDKDVLLHAPKEDVQKLIEHVLISLNTKELEEKAQKPIDKFTFKGKVYECPEDIGNATYGEWADTMRFLKQHGNNDIAFMPSMIGVYYRPKVKGEIEPYDFKKSMKRAEQFKELPITTAKQCHTFFLTITSVLQTGMPASMESRIVRNIKRALSN